MQRQEFNTRLTTVWGGLSEAKAAGAGVAAVREKVTVQDQQIKQLNDERKDLLGEVQTLRRARRQARSSQRNQCEAGRLNVALFRVEAPLTPRRHFGVEVGGDLGDERRRHIDSVEFLDDVLDVARGHALGVEGEDLFIEA